MVKQGIDLESYQNLSKMSIENSYLIVRNIYKAFGPIYKQDQDVIEGMINALLEDTYYNKLTKERLTRKAAGKEIKKAKQDSKLLAAIEEINQKIITNIKRKLPLNRLALPFLKTKADNSEIQSTSKTRCNLETNQIYVHIYHSETIKINKIRSFTQFVIQLAPHMIVEEDESIRYRTSKFKK